ncbi:uncharacterized protein LOC135201812 isoform X6 [Macrobrachium nipponense]|uniref:uncharacterized protein LOC135201812 isoform X6 n=1 Tax=Macrobrachium nipponense TaxID=159736 RepID=UPI0030C8D214
MPLTFRTFVLVCSQVADRGCGQQLGMGTCINSVNLTRSGRYHECVHSIPDIPFAAPLCQEKVPVSLASATVRNCGQAEPMRQAADDPFLDPLPPLPPPSNKHLPEEGHHQGLDIDPKECTDRLCRLPSQCRGGHILGSPRRHNTSAAAAAANSASRLTQSTGNLSDFSLLKKKDPMDPLPLAPPSPVFDKKAAKKLKEKQDKAMKKAPSNFMLLTPWFTRQNCEKLLSQVRSGDILEFNIKLHHHWGIAVLPKNKLKGATSLELIVQGSKESVKDNHFNSPFPTTQGLM